MVQTWRSVVVNIDDDTATAPASVPDIHDGPATELASFPAGNGPVDCHVECLALPDCVVYQTTRDGRYALASQFTFHV